MYLCKVGQNAPSWSEDRVWNTYFSLNSIVTLKIRLRSTLSQCHQKLINITLYPVTLIQYIKFGQNRLCHSRVWDKARKLYSEQNFAFQCWCYLENKVKVTKFKSTHSLLQTIHLCIGFVKIKKNASAVHYQIMGWLHCCCCCWFIVCCSLLWALLCYAVPGDLSRSYDLWVCVVV